MNLSNALESFSTPVSNTSSVFRYLPVFGLFEGRTHKDKCSIRPPRLSPNRRDCRLYQVLENVGFDLYWQGNSPVNNSSTIITFGVCLCFDKSLQYMSSSFVKARFYGEGDPRLTYLTGEEKIKFLEWQKFLLDCSVNISLENDNWGNIKLVPINMHCGSRLGQLINNYPSIVPHPQSFNECITKIELGTRGERLKYRCLCLFSKVKRPDDAYTLTHFMTRREGVSTSLYFQIPWVLQNYARTISFWRTCWKWLNCTL